ncbi:Rv1355c family protein [Mycobacterium intermedium]|uniref:Rv1355c family protein n=1 Tax=Mycobacterium intermedium TaxID=28445 RepID=UPI000848CE24|nr:Rv1355c family protein [Mycobacterium intermedium]MCV6963972.1 Rv1355c family protein [Mycobacterium intermedium]ODR00214.1 hypothetical protein BHQ20_13920 [Mycobacterium intermedium]
MNSATHCSYDDHYCAAVILNARDVDGRRALARLRADPRTVVIDRWKDQVASARRLLPPFEPYVLAESKRWAYYPWRHTLISILARRPFQTLRLDRNRNLITTEEQHELSGLRVGVIGMGAGHVIAYLLAAEGLCGQLRLADSDSLDLSDLNRVPATVFDLGMNKAVVAARRIAELDPYLPVELVRSVLSPDTLTLFLDGLDVVVDGSDSLETKTQLREAARALQIPVLMPTGDQGVLDVERFDLDPSRGLLHGLLDEGPYLDKDPYVLRIVKVSELSTRAAASLLEVDETITAWPQLAGDVALGAAAVAEAVRRIGLGESLPSGRIRIDVARALDQIAEPVATPGAPAPPIEEHPAPASPLAPELPAIIAAAAQRAPSVANMQPWQIEAEPRSVTIRLRPERTATLDIGFRASAVAVGSALFNAKVAAATVGLLGPVHISETDGEFPLSATMRLQDGSDPELAQLYEPMLQRETNRHLGTLAALDEEIAAAVHAAAVAEGARLELLTDRNAIEKVATILAKTDRIRYLTPRMHAEMLSEVRWPAEDQDPAESGIDVRSLEMNPAELSNFQIAQRHDVVSKLAEWGSGSALGKYTHDRICASSGLGMVTVQGDTLTDYARGGSAMEAVWITAQELGLSVQPITPVFLYARSGVELRELSSGFAVPLQRLQCAFHALTHTGPDESPVAMLRFSYAPAPSVRSLRRSLNGAGAPAHCTSQ